MYQTNYRTGLTNAMEHLGQDPRVVFMGQAVVAKGTAMTDTLADVPREKKIELPVAEEMQMGMAIGWALAGFVPVTIYPRWNFLLLAVNQLVNHLDKMIVMSQGEYRPKVIIRTSVGSERPINPQVQHTGDFTDAFKSMLSFVDVIKLDTVQQIWPAYKHALNRTDGKSTLIVEVGDYYNEK